jgi:glycosyltransferase involved in cell wall biosynthesis
VPRVSVIVPSFNHAPYLSWRLDSVLDQTWRDLDLLVLDDASTDDSMELLERYRERPRVRIHRNEQNSGSVFRQWEAGLAMTDSEYVWMAESDDWADPRLVERLVAVLDRHPAVGVAYAQSWIADRTFAVTGDAVCWTEDLDPLRWRGDFVADGRDEIRRFLLVKNTIPNASAVLMRRRVVERVRPIDASFRLCGDWMHWVRMLTEADVAFVAEHLNFWRLQSSSVRTVPPGILEWQEGERVLTRACELVGLNATERDRVLLAFLRRCWQWLCDDVLANRAGTGAG